MPFPTRSLSRSVSVLLAGPLALSLALTAAPAGAGRPAPGDPDAAVDAVVSQAATDIAADAAALASEEEDVVDPDEALDRAEEVLTEGTEPPAAEDDPGTEGTEGTEGAELDSPVDASMALRDLYLARPAMNSAEADRAETLLARPTTGNDPLGTSYTAPSRRECGPHVCVHYVERTADAPPSRSWVRTNVKVLEEVWRHHIGKLGYRSPLPDGGRGGDRRFDVYLAEIGNQGLYGYCPPEGSGGSRRAASYCVLDDDFARAQFGRDPIKTLRVTAAHEFFHAVQYAYDVEEDLWLLESTATWMEEVFADGVNDNRSYLPYGQVRRPGTSLDFFNPDGFEHYGNWTFWNYLGRRYGNGVVRRVFNQVGAGGGLPNRDSITGTRRVLDNLGSFSREVTRYFGVNSAPGRYYAEGRSWGSPAIAAQRRLTPSAPVFEKTVRINHLASRHLRVTPSDSFSTGRYLRAVVNAPSSTGRFTAFLTVIYDGGRVVRRAVSLNSYGNGQIVTPFSRKVTSATVTVANLSTRYDCYEGTTYACRGRALDDSRPFNVLFTAYRR